MNKLIKRFFPSPVHAFFLPLYLKSSLPNQKEREKEEGREEERKTETRVRQRMSAYAEVQQQQERGEEWSRLERREEARERDRESQMSSWNDVPHSPRLRIPKYLVLEMWKPGARRTPFPREALLVSLARETAGSSGVQTSAKRQAREMCTHCASFFPPLFPPFSYSPSLFFLSLCCVSDTTPLFYQINISQNKSQDNFKLASEERGEKKRETG